MSLNKSAFFLRILLFRLVGCLVFARRTCPCVTGTSTYSCFLSQCKVSIYFGRIAKQIPALSQISSTFFNFFTTHPCCQVGCVRVLQDSSKWQNQEEVYFKLLIITIVELWKWWSGSALTQTSRGCRRSLGAPPCCPRQTHHCNHHQYHYHKKPVFNIFFYLKQHYCDHQIQNWGDRFS